MDKTIRIIGIDPGLRLTGWGIIDVRGNEIHFVDCGVIHSEQSHDLSARLVSLYEGLETVIKGLNPQEAAVEQTFVNVNPTSTLKLGQARGIALLAPARQGIQVSEYAPNAIKKTIIGVGHGDKKQIRMMVGVLLPKARFEKDDEADALAIALCHAQWRKVPK